MTFFEEHRIKKPKPKAEEPMVGQTESPEDKKERLNKVLEEIAIAYSEIASLMAKGEVSVVEKVGYQNFKKKIEEFESNESLQKELQEYMEAYVGEDESLRWRVDFMLNKLAEIKARKTQTP